MKCLKVLVAEDIALSRKFIKSSVEKSFSGVYVDEAMNGKEAQGKLEQSDFTLVLSDWEMPLMSGIELLEWLRAHTKLYTIPFIMITERCDRESVIKAIELGANAYVIKPFSAESLAARIISVIDKCERRGQERFEIPGSVALRFSNHSAEGQIIDTSVGGLLGVFERHQKLPSILEESVIDIMPKDHPPICGINSFTVRIQAVEAVADAKNIKIALKFSDLAPEQSHHLQGILKTTRVKMLANASKR